MKSVSIIGHFAQGRVVLNGQTIKTKIIADQLENIYGKENVRRIDTADGWRFLLRLPFSAFYWLCISKNIIMLPAHNGVRIIPLVLVVATLLFHRRLFYVVIGGWLPEHTRRNVMLRWILRRLNRIFPESLSMKIALEEQGFQNITIMPNTKPLDIANIKSLPDDTRTPLSACTFSRVMREKGIEEAVEAVILNTDAAATDRLIALAAALQQSSPSGTVSAGADSSVSYWRTAPVEERLFHALSQGISDYLADDIPEALHLYGDSPVNVIEGPLMQAMERIGQLFGEGKMFLPQVVKSAKVMPMAMSMTLVRTLSALC